MSKQQERIEAFTKLGKFFNEYCEHNKLNTVTSTITDWYAKLDEVITLAGHKNGWFTQEQVLYALKSWGQLLNEDAINAWLSNYSIEGNTQKTVALILAGNIPLVGFHDFLSALLTGNKVLVKLSSNDNVLLPFVASFLMNEASVFTNCISFSEEKLDSFDMVIATGSDNTARYFEHYFGSKPNIIRKNRNSIAVLSGNETSEQLIALGEDMFRYYGLGCRSVSKVFVPQGYNFDSFFTSIYEYRDIVNQTKYANNYDYNKAVYLMSEFKFLDNGFLMIKEDNSYSSPIATLFYEQYSSISHLKEKLENDQNKIQCIVSKGLFTSEVNFGDTQKPELSDYADGVDTVEFLLKN